MWEKVCDKNAQIMSSDGEMKTILKKTYSMKFVVNFFFFFIWNMQTKLRILNVYVFESFFKIIK